MLDLKAKLASAGLVTEEDIERVESKKAKGGKKRGRGGRSRRDGAPRLDVAALKKAGKGEAYAAIRSFVERVRLDEPHRLPSDDAAPFHFPTADGQIGRLRVEPPVRERLAQGHAGVVAFMSNSGLAHAVVPTDAARRIAEVFPEWLRLVPDPSGDGGDDVLSHEPR